MPDVATLPTPTGPAPLEFTTDRVALLKRTVAKGATDDELRLLFHMARRTGLDPFLRQLYAIRRWDASVGREVMTFQCGIDGLRLIAERTGRYAPGRAPTFVYAEPEPGRNRLATPPAPQLVSATAFIKKQTLDGTWHEVAATARFDEYVQQTKQGQPTRFWIRMPHGQLAKCFTPDTEVLTDRGFERFDSVTGRILEVSATGLRTTDARPFAQPYTGDLIVADGDMLNFAVTPDHDMLTTVGRVEAQAMLATARTAGRWRIPMCVSTSASDCPMSDADLRLAGYVLADASHNAHRLFTFAVSRGYKVEALRLLAPVSERIRHCKGAIAATEARAITTNFDKHVLTFAATRVEPLVTASKDVDPQAALSLSRRQARIVVDAWQQFDGHTDHRSGARRIYTSRTDHVRALELLAVVAGYSVNVPRPRTSDLSERTNYSMTLSDCAPQPIALPSDRRPGVHREPYSGEVWCVTVPSHTIVVRRRGFTMLCGQCAEALALRRAFPQETSGVYTHDEMQQASDDTPPLEAAGETPITTRGEPDESAPAFVEFKGQQLRTAGITQATFDRIQRACRTVGKPYASKVLQQLHGVESVLELTEPLATLYLDSLETAAEGRTPETP